VTRFETALAQLARVDDDQPIAGRTVEEVSARGKHQLMRFSGDLVLRTHMRMSGSWHLYRPGVRWQRPRSAMRVLVVTEEYLAIAFDVPVAEFLRGSDLARQKDLRRLGPDLLAPEFDTAEAARRLAARPHLDVADALLNQRVLAGIGNVFKCEILFLAGVSPFRKVGALSADELAALLRLARKLLLGNAGPGKGDGIVTYTGGRRTTRSSDPGKRLWVYSRGGEPCRRCGTRIAFARQGEGARVTYWCPGCQPE
jgi:endonuclease-8